MARKIHGGLFSVGDTSMIPLSNISLQNEWINQTEFRNVHLEHITSPTTNCIKRQKTGKGQIRH